MSWESRNSKGRYYTRSLRVGGRVIRQYVGSGELAQAIAAMDEIERQQRQAEEDTKREERARLDAVDEQVKQLDDFTELVARACLVANGYHQHNRGEWRRRRE